MKECFETLFRASESDPFPWYCGDGNYVTRRLDLVFHDRERARKRLDSNGIAGNYKQRGGNHKYSQAFDWLLSGNPRCMCVVVLAYSHVQIVEEKIQISFITRFHEPPTIFLFSFYCSYKKTFFMIPKSKGTQVFMFPRGAWMMRLSNLVF